MKSIVLKLITALTVLTLLVACGNGDATNNNVENQENNNTTQENNTTNETNEQQEESVITVVLTKDKEAETIAEKEIVIEEGDILLDVMKENFDIEEKDGQPGYILGIDGEVADESESMFWALTVNGEMSMVGAAEVELKDGDTVNFDLQSWE